MSWLENYEILKNEISLIENIANKLLKKIEKKNKLKFLTLKKSLDNIKILSAKEVDKIYNFINQIKKEIDDEIPTIFRTIRYNIINFHYDEFHQILNMKFDNYFIEMIFQFFSNKELKNKTAFKSFKKIFNRIKILRNLKNEELLKYQILKAFKYDKNLNYIIAFTDTNAMINEYESSIYEILQKSKYDKLHAIIDIYKKNQKKFEGE